MPSPAPVRPWQGEQKMSKRSWPRAITAGDTGNGNVSTGLPSALPV